MKSSTSSAPGPYLLFARHDAARQPNPMASPRLTSFMAPQLLVSSLPYISIGSAPAQGKASVQIDHPMCCLGGARRRRRYRFAVVLDHGRREIAPRRGDRQEADQSTRWRWGFWGRGLRHGDYLAVALPTTSRIFGGIGGSWERS
jgi:hypothetical protein